MPDPQISSLMSGIAGLIPSVQVRSYVVTPARLRRDWLPPAAPEGFPTGIRVRRDEVKFWFRLAHGDFCVLVVRREQLAFTTNEMQFLRYLPIAMLSLLVEPGPGGIHAGRIARVLAFEQLMVIRYLRGFHARTLWTRALLLDQLQRLTFERYEGRPATSGVVFAADPPRYLAQRPAAEYDFEEFKTPVELSHDFFGYPASYRHVDGANAFFLFQGSGTCRGILRSTDPTRYSVIERASLHHVRPLLAEEVSTNVWTAWASPRGHVNIAMRNSRHLRWLRSRWRFIDRKLPASVLVNQGVHADVAAAIVGLAFTLSELRLGTLILLPHREELRPDHIGYIDDSSVGEATKQVVVGRRFTDVLTLGGGLGIYSADGITTVSKAGTIIDIGEIIDTSTQDISRTAGGGRTQAASAASRFGPVVKVSQDGPISIYVDSTEYLRIEH